MKTLGGLSSAALSCLGLASTASALAGSSWQKRIDRALLQVDGVSPNGRFRSLQRALKDPKLQKDVTRAINKVRKKGFGKGHPEFIEILWPEGTQARRDLEAINALTKQLPERRDEVTEGSSNPFEILQSTIESVKFGDEGAAAVATSLFESVREDPNRALKLAENALRNEPIEVDKPAYQVLEKYVDDASENDENKSFLSVPPLEIRQYDTFQSVSVPLPSSYEIYTLRNMGPALTELFSYNELGNNDRGSLMPMTAPFFISDSSSTMFVKVPEEFQDNPPAPVGAASIEEFPETVLATLSFPGVCTNEEIERQKAKLMERIESAGAEGWKTKIQEGGEAPEFYVLQYNAPGTLPWRRNNEIAVVMEVATVETDAAETVAEAETDETEEEGKDSGSETDNDSVDGVEDATTTESQDE